MRIPKKKSLKLGNVESEMRRGKGGITDPKSSGRFGGGGEGGGEAVGDGATKGLRKLPDGGGSEPGDAGG